MSNTTTTTKGFRVEDITFHNARRQSAIEEEMRAENPDMYEEDSVKVPISLTPEQVIAFYKQKIECAKDSNEKRLYSQTIQWITELTETKKKLIALESKQNSKSEDSEYDNGIEEN